MTNNIYCTSCGEEIGKPSRDGERMLVKSRACLYDPSNGDLNAVCPKCKVEVKIPRKRLIIHREKSDT